MGYFICNATQKPLYSYKPDDGVTMVPDLADGAARGLRGRQDRHGQDQARASSTRRRTTSEVTSADVKYAIERGFFSLGGHRLHSFYFADLVGAEGRRRSRARRSRASRRPTTRRSSSSSQAPIGGVLASGALGLRRTAPVPEEYAAKFDEETPSTYGENQVATGPYMIENDASGKAIGYEPRQAHPPRPQPELGQGARTSSRPTSTRSTTSRATTIRASPRAAS